MEILRVENYSKVGLYCSKIDRPDTDWSRHPLPGNDEHLQHVWYELACPYEWYFGFKDMHQLESWWSRREWGFLYDHNETCLDESKIMGLSTYDVDSIDLHIGRTQVIFIMDKAQRLKFEPFTRVNALDKIISVMTGQ